MLHTHFIQFNCAQFGVNCFNKYRTHKSRQNLIEIISNAISRCCSKKQNLCICVRKILLFRNNCMYFVQMWSIERLNLQILFVFFIFMRQIVVYYSHGRSRIYNLWSSSVMIGLCVYLRSCSTNSEHQACQLNLERKPDWRMSHIRFRKNYFNMNNTCNAHGSWHSPFRETSQ